MDGLSDEPTGSTSLGASRSGACGPALDHMIFEWFAEIRILKPYLDKTTYVRGFAHVNIMPGLASGKRLCLDRDA